MCSSRFPSLCPAETATALEPPDELVELLDDLEPEPELEEDDVELCSEAEAEVLPLVTAELEPPDELVELVEEVEPVPEPELEPLVPDVPVCSEVAAALLPLTTAALEPPVEEVEEVELVEPVDGLWPSPGLGLVFEPVAELPEPLVPLVPDVPVCSEVAAALSFETIDTLDPPEDEVELVEDVLAYATPETDIAKISPKAIRP